MGLKPVSALQLLGFLSCICIFATSVQPSAAENYDCSASQNYYTASKDEYLFSILSPIVNLTPLNLWDGPLSLSAAPTTQTTTPLTVDELKYYNYMSASAYCPYTLPDLNCCYCSKFNSTVTHKKFVTNSVYDTMAMITLHPTKSEIVVTFRGSVAILNFILDFTLLPVSYNPDIKIHTGLYLCLMSLYNEVVVELNTLITANPTYRVVVTGHSLGASMSSMFVFFMKKLNQFPTTNFVLTNYGQLRTGNKGYADYMNNLNIPMARVVARADVAAHIIPTSAFGLLQLVFGMYYVHHGQEVWINGATTTFCSKTKYEDPTCSNSMGPAYTLADHFQYFDADYSSCYFVEDPATINLISLPVGWTPTTYIPPMPTKLYNFLLPIQQGGYQGLLPLL